MLDAHNVANIAVCNSVVILMHEASCPEFYLPSYITEPSTNSVHDADCTLTTKSQYLINSLDIIVNSLTSVLLQSTKK